MREYLLPINNVHLVINDLSLSLYRMLAELCNTKNSRYFDGKRVLNDGIHTSMVIVYSKVEAEKLQCQVGISVVRVSFRP